MRLFQLGEMIGMYLYEAFESKILNVSSVSIVGFSAGAHIGSAMGQTIFRMFGNATKLPRLYSSSTKTYLSIFQSETIISE